MKNTDFNKFANSFQAIARLRLEAIECLLKYLGNPHKDLDFIHVAGTNGKGSVCNFLQSIFTKAGYHTGLYTSPNLISVCERISVDGKLISEDELEQLLNTVEIASNKVAADLGDPPTQFEIWTAAAFLYFKQSSCDIVVLETGLGGTRDATNIIPPPLASVITRLDLDHTEYLGDTIEAIATEKAGIIKSHTNGKAGLCVTSQQSNAALAVIKSACKEKNNRLLIATAPQNCRADNFHEVFDYTTSDGKIIINNIKSGICGFYQPENAALAAECANALGISPEFIISGIAAATNPGRFEIISQDPLVIYDGAHNKNGMSALVSCLKRYFPNWNGGAFIIAFMGDKDMDSAFEVLKKSELLDGSSIYAVQVKNNPRAASAEKICEVAQRVGISATPFEKLDTAYKAALVNDKPVILCGSLYLYKDFDEVLRNI